MDFIFPTKNSILKSESQRMNYLSKGQKSEWEGDTGGKVPEDMNSAAPLFIYGFIIFLVICILFSLVKAIYCYYRASVSSNTGTAESTRNTNSPTESREPSTTEIQDPDINLINSDTLRSQLDKLKEILNKIEIRETNRGVVVDISSQATSEACYSMPSSSDLETLWSSIDFDDFEQSAIYEDYFRKTRKEQSVSPSISQASTSTSEIRFSNIYPVRLSNTSKNSDSSNAFSGLPHFSTRVNPAEHVLTLLDISFPVNRNRISLHKSSASEGLQRSSYSFESIDTRNSYSSSRAMHQLELPSSSQTVSSRIPPTLEKEDIDMETQKTDFVNHQGKCNSVPLKDSFSEYESIVIKSSNFGNKLVKSKVVCSKSDLDNREVFNSIKTVDAKIFPLHKNKNTSISTSHIINIGSISSTSESNVSKPISEAKSIDLMGYISEKLDDQTFRASSTAPFRTDPVVRGKSESTLEIIESKVRSLLSDSANFKRSLSENEMQRNKNFKSFFTSETEPNVSSYRSACLLTRSEESIIKSPNIFESVKESENVICNTPVNGVANNRNIHTHKNMRSIKSVAEINCSVDMSVLEDFEIKTANTKSDEMMTPLNETLDGVSFTSPSSYTKVTLQSPKDIEWKTPLTHMSTTFNSWKLHEITDADESDLSDENAWSTPKPLEQF